jgi:DNA-binding beta-propeller fold protein YncE
MGRAGVVWLLAAMGILAQQTSIPHSDELSGRPYAIHNKWVIGGTGDWDYLTLDPAARRLYIAHGRAVQVVDIESGAMVGTIPGFRQAHAVVLDDPGPYGYATDGFGAPGRILMKSPQGTPIEFTSGGAINIFDRRSFSIVAGIITTASPRALTLDPQTGLLFALGTDLSTLTPPEPARRVDPRTGREQAYPPPWPPPPPSPCDPSPAHSSDRVGESVIAVIDPQKRARIGAIRVCGILGAATADGAGGIYFTFTTLNMAARLDTQALLDAFPDRDRIMPNNTEFAGRTYSYNPVPELDWRNETKPGAGYGDLLPQLRTIPLGDCKEAHGVAIDTRRNRLFVGCNNMKLAVLDSVSGNSIASFTVGPGTDSIAYDPARGLIFAANGGGYGSVTIIRQHETDSYAVIQNLPTLEQARTMAIDPSTGLLYLVTTLNGVDLRRPPANGIGTLKMKPINGSFQVLVVGN